MNPVTHGLLSWLVANGPRETTRRERVLVTVGGLIPDIDGVGAVPDLITRRLSETPTAYFHEFHHLLHTLPFALVVTAGAAALAPAAARARTAALFFATFHLHLLCDVAGSRGPDGSQWEIPYLWPLSDQPQLRWSGQWPLDAWPNVAITVACLLAAGWLGVRRGRTILEVLWLRGDAEVVRTLRARFGGPAGPPG